MSLPFTLRFPKSAKIMSNISYLKMRSQLIQWAEMPTDKKPDTIVIQAYTDILQPDLRFEIRLKLCKTEANDGFLINSSWGAWYYSTSIEKDYPHAPQGGYELSVMNIRNCVLPVIKNYYNDIVLDRFKLAELPHFKHYHGYSVIKFNAYEEIEFHTALLNEIREKEFEEFMLLSTEVDSYVSEKYDNWVPSVLSFDRILKAPAIIADFLERRTIRERSHNATVKARDLPESSEKDL